MTGAIEVQKSNSNPTKSIGVLNQLRKDIVTCRISPGSKLRFEELINRYGGSMSTIREALIYLVTDDLVYTAGRRGFWVTDVSHDDFRDLTHIRTMIESEALRLSILHGDHDWEGQVVMALHVFDRLETTRSKNWDVYESQAKHTELHQALIAGCGSKRLLSLSRRLAYQNSRYRQLFSEVISTPAEHIANHASIVDAAINRDTKTACKLLKEHIQVSAKYMLDGLSEDDWQARIEELKTIHR